MSDAQSKAVSEWMTGYRKAWESNDPDDIRALFTDDALYYHEPFVDPLHGTDAIVASWLARRDAPGSTTFVWAPLVITDELAIVQGETDYGSVRFSNLWVIRLVEDGRATEFTEWWMDHAHPSGG